MKSAVPRLPPSHPDQVTHNRRLAETVNNILGFQHDDSRIQTAAEASAGVTPVNYAYAPGDFRRYGADPTGSADSTAAFTALNTLMGTMTLWGGGAQCSYKTSISLNLQNNADIDGQGCTVHVTADVPAITNATGTSVVFPRVRNITLRTDVVATSATMDLVDVSRGSFSRILSDRGVAGKSWGYMLRLRASASVCLWNRFDDLEADAVNTGFINLETSNTNQNVFVACKLINDSALPLAHGVKFTLAGDNAFFDLDLEANFSGAGSNYGVDFNTGTNNGIHKLRTEGYTGSSSFYGVNYGGAAGANWVNDHYFTGTGATAAFNGLVAGNTYVAGGYVYNSTGSLTGLKGEIGWDSIADRFKATTNGGGKRLVVQSPALDNLDMNGLNITNMQHQSTGWGTPTGAVVTNNFNGASATLSQCSQAIAAILNALLSTGQMGS